MCMYSLKWLQRSRNAPKIVALLEYRAINTANSFRTAVGSFVPPHTAEISL